MTQDEGAIELFVNGTLMRGLALHANLEGAEFLEDARTASCYRLYSIGDVHPGMYRVQDGGEAGISVQGELYSVPPHVLRRVEAGEPPGLYVGRVTLSDGREVAGVLYPPELAHANGTDISHHGGWRAYAAAAHGTDT